MRFIRQIQWNEHKPAWQAREIYQTYIWIEHSSAICWPTKLWVGWCGSSRRPWFWPVHSIYYIHTTHYSRILINSNKLYLRDIHTKSWCGHAGVLDDLILSGFRCAFTASNATSGDIAGSTVCNLTLQRGLRQWTRRQGDPSQMAEIRKLRVNSQLLNSK